MATKKSVKEKEAKEKDAKQAKKDEEKAKQAPTTSPLLRRLSIFRSKSKQAVSADQRPSTAKDVRTAAERGKGHSFKSNILSNPTWCDHCDDFIWGLLKQCVQCENCKLTCHKMCEGSVVLDCSGVVAKRSLAQEIASERVVQNAAKRAAIQSAGPRGQGVLTYLTPQEVHKRVEDYNALTPALPMQLLDDPGGKLFKGSIRVSLNLVRPIKVVSEDAVFGRNPIDMAEEQAAQRSPDISLNGPTARPATARGSEASTFYLPNNVSKGLFLQSTTTTHEVISILLTKFKIVTHPRKFALFERNTKDNSCRRLRRFEEPLVLVLLWGGGNTDMILSLQENEEDISFPWEDFGEAELENFLRILDAEQQEHIKQIAKRYELRKQRLTEAIAECTNTSADSVTSDEVVRALCERSELS
eukprot:m.367136 g.367136  ORF g.367136 m.367136 type:complete len:415 (+) comp56072_c0_seq15:226-1470(+)